MAHRRLLPLLVSLCLFLARSAASEVGPQLIAAAKSRHELVQLMDQVQMDLLALEKSQEALRQVAEKLSTFYSKLSAKVAEVAKLAAEAERSCPSQSVGAGAPPPTAQGGDSQAQLLQATRNMQEMQMSFNLQYLALQSQMQHENRSFTTVSNIMKTKHDTVKNSISNIR